MCFPSRGVCTLEQFGEVAGGLFFLIFAVTAMEELTGTGLEFPFVLRNGNCPCIVLHLKVLQVVDKFLDSHGPGFNFCRDHHFNPMFWDH